MKAIIAAAGTAGHINPGIAIANKIKEKEPNSKIIFIGTTRGLENDLVPRAGYELKLRAFSCHSWLSLPFFLVILVLCPSGGVLVDVGPVGQKIVVVPDDVVVVAGLPKLCPRLSNHPIPPPRCQ